MISLQQLANQADLNYTGQDIPLPNVSIDSRTIKKGELFVALVGPHFDGHAFLEQAIAKGAAAVLVQKKRDFAIPQIIAQDTTVALGKLAKQWRKPFTLPFIGLTGSCGKTTTKQMLAHIVQECGPALVTHGNQNNAIGLPLTLLRLRSEHDYAVIEMGTNAVGEIPYLAEIAKPTVSMITNIRASHLEGLGSLEGIAQEKGAIYDFLSPRGTAVINFDEPFDKAWRARLRGQSVLTFSQDNHSADIFATDIHTTTNTSKFTAHTPLGTLSISLPIPGQHQITNALAAIAAAIAAGLPTTAIQQGLAKMEAVVGRFKPYQLKNGALVIDDTYNASASSVKSAIDALGEHHGKRILVMSNMGELGKHAEHYHTEMGHWAKENRLDICWLFGDRTLLQHTIKAYPEAKYFEDKHTLAQALSPHIDHSSMVIIKGSRANKMEEILTKIIKE